jgi:hypothetical protein
LAGGTIIHRLPEIKQIHTRLKQSAKSRNIPFDLSLSDLNNLTFPLTCPILNIPLKFNRGSLQDNSYSVDRIDSSKGYTIENIEIISWRANRLKNNGTIDEIQKLAAHLTSKD